MINVTKAYLPPLSEYNEYLKKIWNNNCVTNDGPLLKELEEKLKKYLGVKNLFLVSNGTIALQIAIKSLDLKDYIITTPFSFSATTSSIVWSNCKPIFADINKDNLNINPKEIKKKISKKTTAILATHVFGNPCDVKKIDNIAKKHKLKVIYDAAHTFGINYNGKSILNYGDISILSLHATKLFHTIEGGALITNNDRLAEKISHMRHFGQEGPENFLGLGTNGKNSEFHAAMGLCILPKVVDLINKRKKIFKIYDNHFTNNNNIVRQKIANNTYYNYSYYPIILPAEKILLSVKQNLEKQNIFPRRYFYPSLNKLNYVDNQPMLISEDIASRILCLPMAHDLTKKDVNKISKIVLESL